MSTNSQRLPAFFVSHGAPTIAMGKEPTRTVQFFKSLGKQLLDNQSAIRALLVLSAHWESSSNRGLEITSGDDENPLIYGMLIMLVCMTPKLIPADFYGFPEELYHLQFKSKASSEVSREIAELLSGKHKIPVTQVSRGLDHGCWSPLRLMFPQGPPFPVIQLSLHKSLDYEYHIRLGVALRELRTRGIVLIGSGGSVHNLGEIHWDKPEGQAVLWAGKFATDIIQLATASSAPSNQLLTFVQSEDNSNNIKQAHPRAEHFMPLFVIAGCTIDGEERLKVIHDHIMYGTLGLTAFETENL